MMEAVKHNSWREFALDWGPQLQASAVDLHAMNGSTERDFLAITEKLTGFRSAAREISSGAQSLLASITDQRGDAVCGLLAAIRDAARQMQGQGNPAAELEEIRDAVALIRRSLAGFERVGPSFQVIAILAQRETAHLGSEGLELGTLADDFRAAGGSIQSRVEGVVEAAAVLERRIDSALHDASIFNERFSSKLPTLIGVAEQSLDDFRTQQTQSVRSASRLASESEAVGKAIADLVTSIQMHDITRQQVEHVADSLKELCPQGFANGAMAKPPTELGAALELQLAQLANSRTAFVDTLRRMDRGLETLGAQVNAMVTEAGSLLGSPGSRRISFYSRMEQCFQAIRDTAAECRKLEENTVQALDEVHHSLERLQEATRDTSTVEFRLKRLAINAVISAGHLGAAGEPLRALAMEMLQLVKECESSSGAAAAAISGVAQRVRSALANARTTDIDAMHQLFARLQAEIDYLHNLGETASCRSTELAQLAGGLSTDVEGLRKGASAERVFTSTVDRCCDALRRVQGSLDPAEQLSNEILAQFHSRYTMNAERDVHAALCAPGVRGGADMVAIPPPASAEFGDNVELF